MKYTYLGQTQLYVSRIALGLWHAGGDWGAVDEAKETATIRRALDLGINFFDTAQAYGFGASERQLGAALKQDPRRARQDRDRHEGRASADQQGSGPRLEPGLAPEGNRIQSAGSRHRPCGSLSGPLAGPRDAVCRGGRRSERVRTPRESTICWRLELQHRRTRRIGPV